MAILISALVSALISLGGLLVSQRLQRHWEHKVQLRTAYSEWFSTLRITAADQNLFQEAPPQAPQRERFQESIARFGVARDSVLLIENDPRNRSEIRRIGGMLSDADSPQDVAAVIMASQTFMDALIDRQYLYPENPL